MKSLRLLFVTLVNIASLTALSVSLNACEEQPATETKTPVLKFEQTTLTIPAEGGSVDLAYQVDGVATVDISLLEVSTEAEWLSIASDTESIITISAEANTSEGERTAEIIVGYATAEKVTISVSQANSGAPIVNSLAIEVVAVDSTTITIDVTASNEELTWIPMITYKEYWSEDVNQDEIFASDVEYFEYMAEVYDVSLGDFLAETVAHGSQSDIVIEGLDPLTEYVIYVYGISLQAERTTDIVWAEATTEAPYEGDITFEFDVNEENYIMEFTVTPSHRGVDYYHGLATEAEIESWKELAGSDSLRDAIQVGDIEASITRYMDYGFIEERIDYFWMYTESDVMDYGWEEINASTKYILYAAKWNDNCEIVGEVSYYEYDSPAVEPSDNILTLKVTEITQSSVTVSVEATNFDPYVIIPIRSSEIAGMTDDEIFAYIIEAYDYLVGEYTYAGNRTDTFTHMRPETNYTILTFGHLAGIQTTQMWREEITTLASGDPKDCTFEFNIIPDTDYAWVEITPSDKGHYYHWMLYPAGYTTEDAEAYINYLINDMYDGDVEAFSSWELSIGDESTNVWDLTPSTEYKLGLVIMDYSTGELLTDFIFSEVFSTLEVTYADIAINVTWDKYFDVDALVAAGYSQYAEYSGQCVLPVTVTTEGECSEFYYDIYNNDLTDESTYPDEIFYEGLWYGSYFEDTIFVVPYDKVVTLVAVAYDYSYNPSRLYRELLNLSAAGASPIEEFGAEPSSIKASVVIMPEESAHRVRVERTRSVESMVYTSEAESKREAAIANIDDARRSSIESDIERRRALHTNEARRIAL